MFGCKTVQFNKMGATSEPEENNLYDNIEQELQDNENAIQDYLIEEKLKDVPDDYNKLLLAYIRL